MRVTVKQRHIDQALALRAARGGGITSWSCPLALAMKESAKIPVAASAAVTTAEARLYMADMLVGLYLPSKAAHRFIEAFDRGETVTPHTFMLTEIK